MKIGNDVAHCKIGPALVEKGAESYQMWIANGDGRVAYSKEEWVDGLSTAFIDIGGMPHVNTSLTAAPFRSGGLDHPSYGLGATAATLIMKSVDQRDAKNQTYTSGGLWFRRKGHGN